MIGSLKKEMQSARVWFRRIYFWLSEEPAYIGWTLVVICCFAVVSFLLVGWGASAERVARYAGTALQLVGIFVTAYGVCEWFSAWKNRRPKYGEVAHVVVPDTVGGGASESPIISSIPLDANCDEQGECEKKIAQMRAELLTLVNSETAVLRNRLHALGARLQAEKKARIESEDKLRSELQAKNDSNLRLVGVGAALIFFGVLACGIAPDLM